MRERRRRAGWADARSGVGRDAIAAADTKWEGQGVVPMVMCGGVEGWRDGEGCKVDARVSGCASGAEGR